jgi:hypothetical protein
MLKIQNPQIRSVLDLLEASPPNSDMPLLDNKTLNWVYPVSPEFLNPDPVFWRLGPTSIDGTNINVLDNNNGVTTLTFDQGGPPRIATEGRYYQSIEIRLAGGTVGTIGISISSRVTSDTGAIVAYLDRLIDMANPGRLVLGPIYCPPQVVLQITNETQGGAGDTLDVFAHGLIQPIGTPTPMIPPITFENT